VIRVKRVDPAKPATAALLQWLQLEVLPQDVPMEPGDGVWWVAYDGPSPIAFASLKVSELYPEGWAYLSRAGVLPPYRGRGLQKRLIRAREAFARRSGLTTLITDTTCSNAPSSNSLIACGFRLYQPARPWGLPSANYWIKRLTRQEQQHG
jgi:GNAT superfamily N-acetyltransferase